MIIGFILTAWLISSTIVFFICIYMFRKAHAMQEGCRFLLLASFIISVVVGPLALLFYILYFLSWVKEDVLGWYGW